MTDHELLQTFEDCSLSENDFHHPQHVRVAWLYLGQGSLIEALQRFTKNLRRFAASKGKPDRYHETITWAYVFLIHERVKRNGQEQNWQEFVVENPDLFDWKNSILKSYYRDQTLSSDFARKVFVFPDGFLSEPVPA